MPVSKTSSSGRMPASRMRSASATIVCGALRLALSRKFSEPSVRLAMSGFSSPASASTSARLSSSGYVRPLVDTQSTRPGHRRRSSAMTEP